MIEYHREVIYDKKPVKAKKSITLQSVRAVIKEEIGTVCRIKFSKNILTLSFPNVDHASVPVNTRL